MTVPEMFALFCTAEAPKSLLDSLIDATPNLNDEKRSQLSVVKTPEQREFDRPSEKPMKSFRSGFLGSSLADLRAFTKEYIEVKENTHDNLALNAFVVVDERCVKGEHEGEFERTVLLAQIEDDQLESMRVGVEDLAQVLAALAPGGAFYTSEKRAAGLVDDDDVYHV